MPIRRWLKRGAVITVVAGASLSFGLMAAAASAGPAVSSLSPSFSAQGDSSHDWSMRGQNYGDTASQPGDNKINPHDAGDLTVKWAFTTHRDVSATPAVAGRAVYFPDWAGYLYKLSARTGKVIWEYPISDYNGVPGSSSRVSPEVAGNTVYIGDQNQPGFGGATHVMAVNATTGQKEWSTVVDTHPLGIVTGSPVVYDGVVYIGVASKEEAAAENPEYPCCTFRGSEVALDAKTGAILWKDYMTPPNGALPGGFSGNGVWSSPAIDPKTGTLFVTTGNNYTQPTSVTACENAGGTPAECEPTGNYQESILAINTKTGAIKWATGDNTFDAWTLACVPGFPPNNCPPDPGDDADFGASPQLFTIKGPDGRPLQVVGAGQKNGVYWLLNRATGKVIWSAGVGPGGIHGGMEWGTAYDRGVIYFADANTDSVTFTLPNGQTVSKGGFWGALDARNGKILWETADPSDSQDMGAVSTAGGVMFAGSMSGWMYALDGATGKILWSYQGQGSSNAAPAIVGDIVYWGNGYDNEFIKGLPSTTFYAFSIGGH
jgi:polyvinyl alcohol dehydrogenase (cytochrome)